MGQEDAISPVFGANVPAVIARAVTLIAQLDAQNFKHCLRFVIQYARGRNITPAAIEQLVGVTGLDSQHVQAIFTGILSLIRFCVRRKFKSDLLVKEFNALSINEECSQMLLSEVTVCRSLFEEGKSGHKLSLPAIDRLLWRVDVSISTSSLSRALKPSIPMQLHLTDGKVVSFEMEVEQFHELRFTVAKILKEIGDLENHSIVFKIED